MYTEQKIILASGSARRRELLTLMGLNYEVFAADVDESISLSLPPNTIVRELSLRKGTAALAKLKQSKNRIIISADTIVYCNGKILGKPADRTAAIEMLSLLSGKTHQVYTGVTVIDTTSGKTMTFSECTDVIFRTLTHGEIERYTDNENPYDKAGAYGIQGRAAVFAERIDGDFYNIVGLPISHLAVCLHDNFGFEY